MAKNLEISVLLDFYGSMLTEKQRAMIEYYYNDDLSLGEIAENEGITRQGVRDAIKRAEAQLFDMEEKLGLAKRFREMRGGLEEIIDLCSRMSVFNKRYLFSKDVEEGAQIMTSIAKGLLEL